MKKRIHILLLLLFILTVSIAGTVKVSVKKTKDKALPVITKRASVKANRQHVFNADIAHGIIGTANELHFDKAYDNIFHVRLPQLPAKGECVVLHYKLKGAENYSSVPHSVNDAQANGGQFVVLSDKWSAQHEYIALANLHKGDNVIRFGLADNAAFNYEIKDLSFSLEKAPINDEPLLNMPDNGYYGSQAYVRGVVNSGAKLFFNNVPVKLEHGGFEILTNNPSGTNSPFSGELKAVYPTGREVLKTINFNTAKIAQLHFASAKKGVSNQAIYKFSSGLFLRLNKSGARTSVTIARGSLPVATKISITALRNEDIAPVGTDMLNVTGGARAYRFLPHGSKFAKPAYIRLPIDSALLPDGYTKEDVHTFYFDEDSRTWLALKPDSAKTPDNILGAVTTHFTDMINAVIKVPESPQTQGYTPTSIKDYKAADPSAKITMIAPPVANSTGSSTLSFPIELPKGRMGMQPGLTIQYNNEGGNGWMGIGWNLSVPAIDIDTRWGAPRYHAALETETYTMAGEQLAPLANRTSFIPRLAERQFHPRIEGAFQKIIRHGSNPATYWWEVTNKNGQRSFYGGTPSSGVRADATLRDAAGNVARWALVQTLDLHGNTVNYKYKTVANNGVIGGSVPGLQLYINEINYTGSGGAEGPYKVFFTTNNGGYQRKDIEISARLGFKMVTADVLSNITIKYNSQVIRSYDFAYLEGEFHKTLLNKVSVNDSEGKLFYAHDFEYFDDVAASNGDLLGGTEDWSPANDHIKGGLINPIPGFSDESSALSTVKANSFGGSLALTIGLFDGNPSKSLTIGGGIGYEGGDNEGLVTMADINGDGLPDKIFKKDGSLFYRANLGLASHAFGAVRPVNGIYSFNKGVSKTTKYNVQAVFYGGFVGYERSNTTTKTKAYFSDFNGDGLLDLASDGSVYFNHLNASGDPVFELSSTATPNPITPSGGIDKQFFAPNLVLQQTQETNFPLQDAVRYWKAPVSGQVSITGPVQLISDNSSGLLNKKQDGVIVSIQVNGSTRWTNTIAAGDYSSKTPGGVSNITVNKGDRIYFRVQSVYNGEGDNVKWDPVIDYQNNLAPQIDANNRLSAHYKASEDFIVDDQKGAMLVKDGTLKISGSFSKSITSDSVRLIINRVSTAGTSNLLSRVYANAQTSNLAPLLTNIAVSKGDTLKFYVQSDSYIDRAAVVWKPYYEYTGLADGSPVTNLNGGAIIASDVVPNNSNFNSWYKMAPAFAPIATDSVAIKPDLAGNGAANGAVVFTVKGADTIYAKQTLLLKNGVVTNKTDSIHIYAKANQKYFFDYAAADPTLAKNITRSQAAVRIKAVLSKVEANLYTNPDDLTLGPLFRGWGQFGYKGTKGGNGQLDESKLNNNEYKNYPNDANAYKDTAAVLTLQNPTAAGFIMMYADAKRSVWAGPDTAVFISGQTINSSRLYLHDVSVDSLMVGEGLQAADKISESSAKSYTLGYFLNGSYSSSTSKTNLDMMDMNGDRFPDVLNEDNVQYTRPNGGLEATAYQAHGLGGSAGKGDAAGATLGGSFLKAESKDLLTDAAINEGYTAEASIGLSGSVNKNDQESKSVWMDINGDGLPDKVYNDGNVALNLGYRFAAPENWGISAIDKNSGKTIGGGGSISALGISPFGENFFGGSFEAGFGITRSTTKGSFILNDVNGDGLPDQVYTDGVQLNTGNGFAPQVSWDGLSNFNNNVSTGESINAAFTVTFQFPIPPIKICINPSINANRSMSREQDQITDIDGDGFPDVLHSDEDGDLKVRRSLIGRTNMLRSVKRPMGGYFAVDYERTGNTYRLPQNKWLLKSVVVFDGVAGDGADTMRSTFAYKGGTYNRRDREFYGFDTVITNQQNTANRNEIYRSTVQKFINQSYYTKGLVAKEWLQDAAGHRFTETTNGYAERIVAGVDSVVFPALTESTKFYYEGKTTPGLSTTTRFDYDLLGNMTTIRDEGDGTAGDILEATITYHNNNAAYIKSIPQSITVNTTQGIKRNRSTIINSFGDVTQISQFLADGSASVYEMKYDDYGNLAQITRPANVKKERMSYAYVYDADVHTYVDKVTDAYGYSSFSKTDPVFGNVLRTISMNNDTMLFAYDKIGRMKGIIGPYEVGTSDTTIRFAYHPDAVVPYATTQHFDPQYKPGNKDFINTVTFMDGMGRAIQVKKQVSLFTGKDKPDQIKMVVSGRAEYDAFGRAVKNYYPITENATLGIVTPQNAQFNNIYGNITSAAQYDVLDRPLAEVLADGATTKMAYAIGSGFFITNVTDALRNVKETYTDVRERKRTERALSGPAGIITTQYSYDALSQLIKVEDTKGNAINYTYDNLGRKLSAEYPDAGRTDFVYDAAGNLIKKITPQIRKEIPNGGAINYEYDHERLIGIDYQRQYQNKVTYVYGPPVTGKRIQEHRAGRIILQEDASGGREFYYGKLGEVTKEIRTVMVNSVFYTTYISEQKYDTWNRITEMTYPDSERVSYHYNHGGGLDSVSGDKEGVHYKYVNQLGYDEYDQRVYLQYGNKTETNYSYDKLRRRLTSLAAATATGRLMMDNSYAYDAVSNILGIENSAPVVNLKLGGVSSQSYTYDNLYRLVAAKGNFRGYKDTMKYTLAMGYDNLYNVTSKAIVRKKLQDTYTHQYTYAGTAHQPTTIGKFNYTYDLNGNQSTYIHRENFWDEENRLMAVVENGTQNQYTYDAGGDRVIKSYGGIQSSWVNGAPAGTVSHFNNYTVYVSPYLVCRRTSFTKHIYIESQRIATKIGKGQFTNISFPSTALSAGNINYVNRAKQLQADRIKYYATLKPSPGPPTNKLYYAEPQNTGIAAPVLVDSTNAVPKGWPGNTTPPLGGPPVFVKEIPDNDTVKAGYGFKNLEKIKVEPNRYFFHSDHLGSSAFTTNAQGEAQQHQEYTPFGEAYFDQHDTSSFSTPYLFNAKERDDETGLYYYGARYYNPEQSQWLSMDPMVDKYAGLSPYNYVMNNPVRLVDPDGKEWKDKAMSYLANVDLSYLRVANNYLAGFSDAMTLGGTNWLREQIGTNGTVDKQSTSYDVGDNTGMVAGVFMVAGGAVKGASALKNAFSGGSKLSEISTLFHSTSRPGAAASILEEINPAYFNSASRFGKGFYLSNDIGTTVAELGQHGSSVANTIQYSLDGGKLFNATGSFFNSAVKYFPKSLSFMTKSLNYDGVIFNSLRERGINVVLFKSFEVLKNGAIIK